jgi:signal transduction histidine kinase
MRTAALLHLRFAAATALAIAAAGAAMLWFARHEEVRHAERDVVTQAQYIERAILRDELTARDVAAPVTGAELRRLDWLFEARVLIQGGLRAKLYGRDGRVVYSDVHSLIGEPADDPAEQRRVLGGAVVRDVADLNHEGGGRAHTKAIEVYVPLRLRGSRRADGVFELYQSYAPVARSVRAFVMPFAGIVLLTLAALWLVLFPLLRRMSRALERDRAARRDAELALEETEEQLRQSQRLEGLGRLAGGVAHDFNNVLLAINGYAELLVADAQGERARRFAREILLAGERAAALTQQLLAFGRRQARQPRVLDLNESVRELASLLRPVLGGRIETVLELEPRLRPVEADPGQVSQVLLNLALNARDAMDGAGTLVLATRNEGEDAVVSVTDTGAGMDEATRARIFEPFFSTKGEAGNGLGLSTVYGIVAQSGGRIDVESAPGLGSTFAVRLPAIERRPVEARQLAVSGPSGRALPPPPPG